jgi:DNA sulfur modification protein DndE
LKFNRIRVSLKSKNLLGSLQTRTGLTPNIIARFALCMSIKERSVPNIDAYDDSGSEFAPAVLFGEHEPLYLALMINRLKNDRLDPELYLHKMTRAHLNRGVGALSPRINDLSDFYELVKEERDI